MLRTRFPSGLAAHASSITQPEPRGECVWKPISGYDAARIHVGRDSTIVYVWPAVTTAPATGRKVGVEVVDTWSAVGASVSEPSGLPVAASPGRSPTSTIGNGE